MTNPEISSTEFAALKVASRALVKGLGGGDAASLVCRYNPTALSDACSLNRPDRTLPIDVVADLERCAGQPTVTAVLARMQGFALVPMVLPGTREAQAIAEIGRTSAEVFAAWATAMGDDTLSDGERQAVADRILALNAACMQAAAALLAKKGEAS
jgi:hypothetical protein